MFRPPGRPIAPRRARSGRAATVACALALLAAACKPDPESTATPPPPPPAAPPAAAETGANRELLDQLTGTRIDAAEQKLAARRPDEALALLVATLKADPASTAARGRVDRLLREITWNVPTLTLDHRMRIDQLAPAGSSGLWVSLDGPANTTVRWDLDALKLASVLFPVGPAPTRSLTIAPQGGKLVIQRGPATLLCDGASLKPIRDLGPLPPDLIPSAVVAFSPDGLLLAHPAPRSATDSALVWHIRDTATGQILRSSEPAKPDVPPPLAAFLDRTKLRVIHADGSLMEIPVSPVAPVQSHPLPEPRKLLAAQFAADGNAVLTLLPGQPPSPAARSIIGYSDADDGSLEPDALARRFPWSLQPNFWAALMPDLEERPFAVEGSRLTLGPSPHAPVTADSAITAIAISGTAVLTGSESGKVVVHQMLPPPDAVSPPAESPPPDPAALTALENLATALAAVRYDVQERTFTPVSADQRLLAFAAIDAGPLRTALPGLDFTRLALLLNNLHPRAATAESLQPLIDRIARATPLPAASPATTEDGNPLLALVRNGPGEDLVQAVRQAGGKGPQVAQALAGALESGTWESIQAIALEAKDLPPVLHQVALSRVAWLQGRRADALSPWPEHFPSVAELRQREDWDGWEQADFGPALDALRNALQQELEAVTLTADAPPERRQAVADRLLDPETPAALGKARHAIACMNAAALLATFPENAQAAVTLATTARNLGAAAEPCLRAEATALTALGNFQLAHTRWVELVTEHPVEAQLPGDYAEAAYTAFENADPAQAMVILTTGIHRFPNDANFALRAGWVALLTSNPDRAYDFLKAGNRLGFPAEKSENACALLAIAAAQAGFSDDAAVFYNDLVGIDSAWANPQTLDTLDWPEELKATLRQFMP